MIKKLTKNSIALPDYPFDYELLNQSNIYRKSRRFYLACKGDFRASLVSSARTLSSEILLTNVIEYSPIRREWDWLNHCSNGRVSKEKLRQIEDLRKFSSSVFHEQNHRILWPFLPNPPKQRKGIRKFLNFAESLVISLDMALADELGPKTSKVYFSAKVIYDPGTVVRFELGKSKMAKRIYRNYLQIVAYSTYLLLEGYSPKDVREIVEILNPNKDSFHDRAVERALRLNAGFVRKTNARWQDLHWRKVHKALFRKNIPVLDLSDDPLDYIQHYLWTEKVLIHFGL